MNEERIFHIHFLHENRHYNIGLFKTLDEAEKALDKITSNPEEYIAPDNWESIWLSETNFIKLSPQRTLKIIPNKGLTNNRDNMD